jgi:hypothetical protein
MAEAASLSDAGNVAAIVAASASVVAWSVGRWLLAADLEWIFVRADAGTRTPEPFITSVSIRRDIGLPEPYLVP